MNGYQPDSRNYVVAGNVEGGARTIAFMRNAIGTQPVIEVSTYNTFSNAYEDNYYTVTLFKDGH